MGLGLAALLFIGIIIALVVVARSNAAATREENARHLVRAQAMGGRVIEPFRDGEIARYAGTVDGIEWTLRVAGMDDAETPRKTTLIWESWSWAFFFSCGGRCRDGAGPPGCFSAGVRSISWEGLQLCSRWRFYLSGPSSRSVTTRFMCCMLRPSCGCFRSLGQPLTSKPRLGPDRVGEDSGISTGTTMASRYRGQKDVWESGVSYEPYVGRWSRVVAREFLPWLDVPAGRRWLDVGCGTGALSQTIIEVAAPGAMTGVDRSDGFVAFAREHVRDARAQFEVGDAEALPVETGAYDVVVSGLVLNFVPRPQQSVAEMTRAARSDGVVAAYVWDYAGRMEMMRHFWDALTALDPAARDRDEGRRFSICQPDPLADLFRTVGLTDVQVRSIDIVTRFRDFDDYWTPFLGGQGAAPSHAMSLSEERRTALRERIRAGLPFAPDGSIPLAARAWAVRGKK